MVSTSSSVRPSTLAIFLSGLRLTWWSFTAWFSSTGIDEDKEPTGSECWQSLHYIHYSSCSTSQLVSSACGCDRRVVLVYQCTAQVNTVSPSKPFHIQWHLPTCWLPPGASGWLHQSVCSPGWTWRYGSVGKYSGTTFRCWLSVVFLWVLPWPLWLIMNDICH